VCLKLGMAKGNLMILYRHGMIASARRAWRSGSGGGQFDHLISVK